ncbi:MAG: hypothetical protein J7M34_07250 [Anaerolineae bacterium]|nr:hypothetical protein [Anaerolineae bacterium]
MGMMMDAGVDVLWPLERAAGQDPVRLRRKFGRALRLWGGVDKRVLAQGPEAIDKHLRELAPLVEEGGYIPTVDHTVPPDVSWDHFRYYMERKERLLESHRRMPALEPRPLLTISPEHGQKKNTGQMGGTRCDERTVEP